MKKLARFITDERTGLEYELCGDYYIIAGQEELDREPIGIWGQTHLEYIKKHHQSFYFTMLCENKLYDYLLELNRNAEKTFNHLLNKMAKCEGITEKLKADNQIEWIARMNSIKQRAIEVLNDELIYR